MAAVRPTRAALAAMLLAVVALAGCGDDADRVDGGPATTSTDPDWAPAGAEIGLGLVVPEGAHLAGPVFHRPPIVVMEEMLLGSRRFGDVCVHLARKPPGLCRFSASMRRPGAGWVSITALGDP